MVNLGDIYSRLPSVQKPDRKLTFKEKVKWTLGILVIFFVLGSITAWGVNESAVAQFEFLEIVFGSKFGSIITLGIGPIVTASIILQLLIGSKILNWDTKTPEGKQKFMGTQKILAISFSVLEAIAYVLSGAVPASSPELVWVVILQLAFGGILIIFMDEVVSKWGIGSGVSLFIAAGVSKTIILRIFTPPLAGAAGGIISTFIATLSAGQMDQAFFSILPLISLLTVFVIVVFVQAMKIEIPMAFSLPFGKFASRRWPLKFIYTSNIPVILTAAVVANLQVIGRVLSEKGLTFLGQFDAQGQPIGGLVYYVTAPSSIGIMLSAIITGLLAISFALLALRLWQRFALRFSLVGIVLGIILSTFIIGSIDSIPSVSGIETVRSFTYMGIMIIGATIFSMFWVTTAGMDSKSVAEQFRSAFISIPGFRRDPRIIERVLDKYIPALTVLGGAFVGLLAGFADLTNAIGSGTGILLTVMIIYQLYEQIVQQHWDDLPPFLKRIIGE